MKRESWLKLFSLLKEYLQKKYPQDLLYNLILELIFTKVFQTT